MMTILRKPILAVTLMVSLVLVGCGGEEAVSLDPPEVRYNEDISEMGMFVVDPRYTAAWLPEDGDWILFDDIGEMFRYRVNRFPESKARIIWVNDYLDSTWVNAEEAWYVQTGDVNSPMGWGVVAFRNEADARAFQLETEGELLTWTDVLERAWEAPPAPDPAGSSHQHAGTPTAEATP